MLSLGDLLHIHVGASLVSKHLNYLSVQTILYVLLSLLVGEGLILLAPQAVYPIFKAWRFFPVVP